MFVFVYGTLRNAYKEYRHLLDFQVPDVLDKYAVYRGLAKLSGYQMWSLGSYPGIFPVAPKEEGERFTVTGELFSFEANVADFLLATLDDYEGCHPLNALPHEYERATEIVFAVEEQDYVTSWIYRLTTRPSSTYPVISSGDYSTFLVTKYQ
ncbi:AIG2 family protein [Galdieria sulphuraria]|uniref:AIG2 family protein n=1 Tax=Galdieria sulphuraria TaxID=130081 RepID=M2W9T2_GALSU|nr:AIG2 family protein [Galdieria sulphuraria]EME32666.1 AIG2 family protein [Galdieria sulphuraria]|eukprot:XP_005709186.1 AIG2 family protein [Galdieria sulphuraria]